jgi:hypothetical protein
MKDERCHHAPIMVMMRARIRALLLIGVRHPTRDG